MASVKDTLVAAIAQSNKNLTMAQSRQDAAYDTKREAVRAQGAMLDRRADVDSIIEAAKQEADLKAQTRVAAFDAIVSADMAQLAQRANSLRAERDATFEEIKARQGKNLLNDPLGYIVNLFTLNPMIDSYNSLNSALTGVEADMSQKQALVTQEGAAAQAAKQTVTDATKAAALEKISLAASFEKTKLMQEMAGIEIDAIAAMQNNDQRTIQNYMTLYNVEKSEQQMSMERERLALAKRAAERAEAADAAEKQDQTLAFKFIREGAAIAGMQGYVNLDDSQIKLLTKTAEGKARIDMFLRLGMEKTTNGAPRLGNSPAEAYVTARKLGVNFDAVPYGQVLKLVDSEYAALAKKPEFASMKDDQKISALNERVKARLTTVPQWQFPSVGNVVESSGAFKSSALFNKVFDTQLKANPSLAGDPDQVIGIAAAALKAKQISVEEATAGLAAFFKAQKEYRTLVLGGGLLGIKPETTYSPTVRLYGRDINLENPTELKLSLLASPVRLGPEYTIFR